MTEKKEDVKGDLSSVKGPGAKQADGVTGESDEKAADPLYQLLKPLHNLPRGKNAWNPQFIRKPWFWPLSVAVLILLSYVYPHILRFLTGAE